MSDRLGMVCGFLGGTIVAVESGYKVFPHPKPDKIHRRLSDAKWFLALSWCDEAPPPLRECQSTPAGIINNTGELAFFNQIVLEKGEANFIPQRYGLEIFTCCLSLQPNETVVYQLPSNIGVELEIRALVIDDRYGKVALVRAIA